MDKKRELEVTRSYSKGVTAPAAETVLQAWPDAQAFAFPAVILVRNDVRADALTADLAVQAGFPQFP